MKTSLFLAVLALTSLAVVRGAEPRPNVIVILSDDVGYSDLGCFGGEIATPHLDALAAGGLRFTQFYNTARCCPTRASLLTGLYPHQAGVGYMTDRAPYSANAMINEWYAGDLRPDTVTLGEAMRGAGYRTYAIGKWHVTKDIEENASRHNWPLQRGFDRYYGILRGASSFFQPPELLRDNDRVRYDADPEYPVKDFYLTDAFSDHAVKFVNEHARTRAGQPFFMYLAYTAAHWPMHARPADIAKYSGRYDGGYAPIRRERVERMRRLGLLDPAWEVTPLVGDWSKVERKDWEARCMEVYAAMLDNMDQGIGRLVAALKANGQFENTLILYLQDNGACAEPYGRGGGAGKAKAKGPLPMPGPAESNVGYGEAWANVSNTPFRLYKHWVHEGGISTPLIAHWPRGIMRRGALESQPGHLIDIMATCVDVAGASYPAERAGRAVQPMEGRSLRPAFAGRPIAREALFWEHEGNRALRVGDWKLVAKDPAGPWELYDLKRDRTEMRDLASSQPDRVREMASTWDRWARRTHAVPWPWKPAHGAASSP
jgi:arylsulfatase